MAESSSSGQGVPMPASSASTRANTAHTRNASVMSTASSVSNIRSIINGTTTTNNNTGKVATSGGDDDDRTCQWHRTHFEVKASVARIIKALLGEFFCTWIFLFAIFSSIVNLNRSGLISTSIINAGMLTAFAGIVVTATFGVISGAHFNPAVTFAAMLSCQIPLVLGCGYITMQCAASFVAVLCIMLIWNNPGGLVNSIVVQPASDVSYFHAFSAEVLYTFFYILIIFLAIWSVPVSPFFLSIRYPKRRGILGIGTGYGTPEENDAALASSSRQSPAIGSSGAYGSPAMQTLGSGRGGNSGDDQSVDGHSMVASMVVSDADSVRAATGDNMSTSIRALIKNYRSKSAYVPIIIGLSLAFLTLISSTTSGGAFNPARALGPAVIAWEWNAQWVYWVGDLLGSACAVGVYWVFFSRRVFIPEGQVDEDGELGIGPDTRARPGRAVVNFNNSQDGPVESSAVTTEQ